jgi:hypothetical protein
MRCRLILLPLVLLVLASCSGSSKPSAPVAAAPVATVPTTAVAASTTSAVPVTAPVVVSTTSTTVAKRLEVVVAEAAAQNWMVDRENCLLAVDTCDPKLFTPEGSVQRERLTKALTDYRAANFKVRLNTDDPTYLVVQKVELGADRTRAEAKACFWSTDVVFEPNEKAAGGEIISDDTKASYDLLLQVVLVDKQWLITDYTKLVKYEGFNSCPAK